jgi:hypothetical protein
MSFFANMERLCPERLHHYKVRLIDGTVRDGDAEGCWPAGTNLEFMARIMTCGQPRWTCVQRVAKREAVEVRRDGETVWRTAVVPGIATDAAA